MKKYFVLLAILTVAPLAANAEMTTDQMNTEEFMRNQNFSSEAYRIMQIGHKNPMTPVKNEEKGFWKGIGKTILFTVDPTYDYAKFGEHSIEYKHKTVDDL